MMMITRTPLLVLAKSRTPRTAQFFTSALPQARLMHQRVGLDGRLRVGRALGGGMFGARRKARSAANKRVLDQWRGGDYCDLLRECDERLSAQDPDYVLHDIFIVIYSGWNEYGQTTTTRIAYNFSASKHASDLDWDIMNACVDILKDEIAERDTETWMKKTATPPTTTMGLIASERHQEDSVQDGTREPVEAGSSLLGSSPGVVSGEAPEQRSVDRAQRTAPESGTGDRSGASGGPESADPR